MHEPLRMRDGRAAAALAVQFAETGWVRVSPAFREAQAIAYHTALSESEHVAFQRVDPATGFQRWRFGFVPGYDCEHPLCELGRWLHNEGRVWASTVTGLSLGVEADPMLFSDKAAKAMFRDPFDAREVPGRVVAFVVHLTPAAWPATWGGHLELAGHRLAPAWNAIDLVDVRPPRHVAKLPLLERHVAGFVVSGGYRMNP